MIWGPFDWRLAPHFNSGTCRAARPLIFRFHQMAKGLDGHKFFRQSQLHVDHAGKVVQAFALTFLSNETVRGLKGRNWYSTLDAPINHRHQKGNLRQIQRTRSRRRSTDGCRHPTIPVTASPHRPLAVSPLSHHHRLHHPRPLPQENPPPSRRRSFPPPPRVIHRRRTVPPSPPHQRRH